MRAVLFVLLAALTASCETLQFYGQAAAGQWSIVRHEQSTAKLIASANTDAKLRDRLVTVAALLRFAEDRLALEPGKRYSSYVRIEGDAVVWNVFATPEFSTVPTRWCYPVVGCASYRGYFDRRDAKRYAQRLRVERHDTVVGGVAAYSTLGWFDDPVLSTFVGWPDPDLAGLIFHELGHGKVFISGDTSFNEAFASFVERRGVVEWLRANHDDAQIERVTQRWQMSDRFVAYLLGWRAELQRLYDQSGCVRRSGLVLPARSEQRRPGATGCVQRTHDGIRGSVCASGRIVADVLRKGRCARAARSRSA
jgi:predicted aminopeptidase